MAPKVYGPVGPNNADYNSVPLPPAPIFDPAVYENVYQWKVITEDLPPSLGTNQYGEPIAPRPSMMGIQATHPPDVVRKVGVIQSGYARYLEDYKLWMSLCASIRKENEIRARVSSELAKNAKQVPMLRKSDGSYHFLSDKTKQKYSGLANYNGLGDFVALDSFDPAAPGKDGFVLVTAKPVAKPAPAAPDPLSKRQIAKTARKSYKLALTTAIGERKQQLVPQVANLVADRKISKLEERASISVRERASNIKKVNGSQPVDLSVADGEWKLVVGKRATRHREKTTTIRRDSSGRPLGRKIVSAVSFESSAEED